VRRWLGRWFRWRRIGLAAIQPLGVKVRPGILPDVGVHVRAIDHPEWVPRQKCARTWVSVTHPFIQQPGGILFLGTGPLAVRGGTTRYRLISEPLVGGLERDRSAGVGLGGDIAAAVVGVEPGGAATDAVLQATHATAVIMASDILDAGTGSSG